MHLSRLVIAGTHSGVGKTTVTLAILAALKARGRQVQPFKVGPDFIDPGHHTAACGRTSRNLDGWMLSAEANRAGFARAAAGADLSIIEGMMGLFDGSSPTSDTASTAAIAKQLDAPVLLVIDAGAMGRSVAAMARGYADFDPKLRVAGVIFNGVGGDGHYQLLKAAVEATSRLVVVGYLPSDPALTLGDRHLGLRTAIESRSDALYQKLGHAAARTIDLDRIEALASTALLWLHPTPQSAAVPAKADRPVRVAVAYDPAFCFYYPENLELLEAEGAELVYFSPIAEATLPDADLLYLGGGYPELYGERLSENQAMRTAIRDFAERGGAIYAECGGMMYLTEGIRDGDGRFHAMVGLFPVEAVMKRSGLTIGYREVEVGRSCLLGERGTSARGHEFHYSQLVQHGPVETALTLRDAEGRARGHDGLVKGDVVASYTHLHFGSAPGLARALLHAATGPPRASTGGQR